ncbi:beta-ketoacyl synthase N-terminal-like domain-containing protein [Sutcliffiella rhizosphaerae]|nr:beta-ketoacyl synthase N-terminal-like domain-containing protein [Sutcliffiella rhizosphaerae]
MVTGTSILCSAGTELKDVWNNISEFRTQYESRNLLNNIESFPVYKTPTINVEQWFSDKQINYIEEIGLLEDLDFLMLVVSIKKCLINASINPDICSHASLIIAHENLGVASLLNKINNLSLLKQPGNITFNDLKQEFYNIQSFAHLFYISKLFGIEGFTLTVNNACASGSYAIEVGSQLIKNKKSNLVIVAASDYAHPTEYLWLKEKGFCSDDQIRPFDKKRSGTILGDGAACILLESEEHLNKRGVDPQCFYIGSEAFQDSWRMTFPDITRGSYASTITKLINTYKIKSIDLLVPHATGSKLWDMYEGKQIETALKETNIKPNITAFKPYVGHTLGASSLLETVLLIECMKKSIILPIQNLEETDVLGIKENLVLNKKSVKINYAMKTVAAYGGFTIASLYKSI